MNGRFLRFGFLLGTCTLASCVWLDGDGMDEDAGCLSAGGSSGTPEPNLNPEQVAVAGSAIRFTASRLAWAYEPPALGWTSASCVTVTGADADADGFPDAFAAGNVALDSCQRPAFGGTLALSGSATVNDVDDGATNSFGHDAAGAFDMNGAASWTYANVGGDATGYYGLHSSSSVALLTATPDFLDLTLERYEVDAAFTPTAAWTPGTALTAGTFTVEGPWRAIFPEAVAQGEILTFVPLTIDPSCPERITAGQLLAYYATSSTDDGGCGGSVQSWDVYELDVTWTGCGTVIVQQTYSYYDYEDPYP